VIYAIRQNGALRTLIELPSDKRLKPDMQAVRPAYARKWVLDGKHHETGLWVDDGKVRYAEPQS
jgi:hypothetical protein